MKKLTPTARVYLFTCIVSVCGGLNGFDTGSIGGITTMPQFQADFGVLSEFVRGVVVAAILLPIAFTSLAAGSISDRISRKRTISLGCATFSLGSAISCGSNSLPMLILGRCIAGAGQGLFLSPLNVYVSEISPSQLRGRTMLLIQVWTSGAIATGFFVCYGSVRIPSSLSWRLPFALQTLASLALAIISPLLPYSPRWLVIKGRQAEAERVLDLIASDANADERRELLAVPPPSVVTSRREAFFQLFAKGVRGRTIFGAFLQAANPLSGIDFVLFFAPLLFTQAGLNPATASFVASGCTGIGLVVATVFSSFYIDKVGRRTLFLCGGIDIGGCLMLLGTMYASEAAHGPTGKWVVIASVEVFALSFSGTWAVTIRLYASEIQPNATRAAASSFGLVVNSLFNFVVALSAPGFLAKSAYGPYFTYGSFTLFATAVAYAFMPETIGKTLEVIDSTFEGSLYAVKWPQALLSGRHGLSRRARRGEVGVGIVELGRIGT